MPNPFDDESGVYLVLTNHEGQHSLWPEQIEVPAGWTAAYGPAGRQDCTAYIDENWTDLRPASLVRQMETKRA